MADAVSKEVRSRMMSGIKGKNTKPEMIIRKGLHSRGFRYKLHDKSLPGKPDLVFPKYDAVIFVHGCFWHGHDCHLFKWPKSREEFWKEKITGNQLRDQRDEVELRKNGYRILKVWECSIKGRAKLSPDDVVLKIEKWLVSREDQFELRGAE